MKYNYKAIIFIITLIIAIIIFNIYSKGFKETFQNQQKMNYPWSDDLIKRFIVYQNTVNQNVNQYDVEILQQQTTPQEVEILLNTGFWPWDEELKYLYLNAVSHNTMINIQPQFALKYAMRVYNQNAAKELLAWNTKEGQFLLFGANLGTTPPIELSKRINQNPNLVADVPNNLHNTLKCSTDNNGNSIMQKTTYESMNLFNGYPNSKIETIESKDIPNEMPGFNFVSSPCNPCVALTQPGDYSCPFTLNIKGDNNISSIWKKLWNV